MYAIANRCGFQAAIKSSYLNRGLDEWVLPGNTSPYWTADFAMSSDALLWAYIPICRLLPSSTHTIPYIQLYADYWSECTTKQILSQGKQFESFTCHVMLVVSISYLNISDNWSSFESYGGYAYYVRQYHHNNIIIILLLSYFGKLILDWILDLFITLLSYFKIP